MLGQLLGLHGIDTVIVEARSQSHVIERVRAGVLEQGTVDLMHQVGLGDRLARQGLRHEGIYLAFNGRRHRIDMTAASNGRAITVYGQNEVVRDLIDARVAAGVPLYFETPALSSIDHLRAASSKPTSIRIIDVTVTTRYHRSQASWAAHNQQHLEGSR